jgi:hypothetical protein
MQWFHSVVSSTSQHQRTDLTGLLPECFQFHQKWRQLVQLISFHERPSANKSSFGESINPSVSTVMQNKGHEELWLMQEMPKLEREKLLVQGPAAHVKKLGMAACDKQHNGLTYPTNKACKLAACMSMFEVQW